MRTKPTLTKREILKRLRENRAVLDRFTVKKIGLFGSYARNEQTKKSDIDFLVEFQEPTFDHFMGLIDYLENLFQKKVEVITDGSLSVHVKLYIEKEVQWYEVQ
jgi:predicted nucleotidyltransferase